MFVYNYHTHTSRCGHANGTDEEYVLSAIKAGYKVLGFSDHAPYRDYSLPLSRMDFEYLDDYINSINSLKEKYKDQIEIHCGLESEFYPENYDERKYLSERVEYLLFGQHYSEIVGVGSYFKLNSEDEIMVYTDQVCRGLESGLFSYLCHPDVIMNRQVEFSPACARAAHMIGETAAKTNTPVELNIRGVMKGRKHFPDGEKYYYPHYDFWKILAEYPLKIVVGIDAHDPADLLDLKSIDLGLKEVEDLHLDFITEPFLGN